MSFWAHKKGLGVRLSYGVHGNGIVSIDSLPKSQTHDDDMLVDDKQDEMIHTQFPRINKSRKKLTCKGKGVDSKELVKSQTSTFTINSSMYDNFNMPHLRSNRVPRSLTSRVYVPQDILSSFTVESDALTSNMAYDPNCGDVLQLFEIYVTSEDAYIDGIAYLTGESMSILNISVYDYHKGEISLSTPYQIDFRDPVLQVIVNDQFNKRGIIAVRTAAKFYVLSLVSNKVTDLQSIPDFEISVFGEVSAISLARYSFADISFCANNKRKIAVVDIKGNFGVWYINKSVPTIRQLVSDKPNNDAFLNTRSLSNWRRVYGLPSSNNVLETEVTRRTIITSNTWSRIRDFTLLDKYAFMLTSKELIWFDFSNGMKRLISWKHYLDDADPSLKFQVLEIKTNEFTCFVYSQVSPIIIVFTFGIVDNKPFSLRDPYFLRKSFENLQLRQINVHKVGNKMVLFELTTDLALFYRELTIGDNTMDVVDTSMTIPNDIEVVDKYFNQFNEKQLQNFRLQLEEQPLLDDVSESQQIEEIQKYAYELGSGFAKMGSSQQSLGSSNYFSLYDVCNNIPLNVSDLLELDDMIAQLESSLPPDRLKVRSLINNSFIQRNKFINTQQTQTHINDIYKMIDKIYVRDNKNSSKIAVSILIGISLIKCCYVSDQLTADFESVKSEAPSNVQSLLEEWDAEEEEVQSIEETQTQHDSQFLTPSFPTIRVNNSQPSLRQQVLTQNSQSQMIPSSQKFSSQLSSQSRSGSPIPSSSQSRKKRKKKGGF
ncbi:RRN6 RNA polymerase I-specific transcription initiation factor RRN6 [Candida maltosa Xu316]